MKYLVIILMFFKANLFASGIQLNEIRLQLQQSVSDENSCKKLISELNIYNEFNNTTFATYKACATMIMAIYTINPFNKLLYFKEGKTLLEKCIAKQSFNIEIRYLRFTVQTSAPSFLGYNKSINEDKDFLLRNINALNDLQLKQMIVSFLNTSKYVTAIEKQKLKL